MAVPRGRQPAGDCHAIFRLTVELQPEDRSLTDQEWSEIAHHLTRVSGITIPGEDHNGCSWVALRTQDSQLDVVANLIRADGTWTKQPPQLDHLLDAECRRIEADLGLVPSGGVPLNDPHQVAATVSVSGQFAALLHQLADETSGPLATVQTLLEHTTHRLGHLPHTRDSQALHRLAPLAGQIHDLRRELTETAQLLTSTHLTNRPRSGLPRPPAPDAGRAR